MEYRAVVFVQETITRGFVACLNIPGRVTTRETVSCRVSRYVRQGFRSHAVAIILC
jgi:hypothetical protein